MDNEISTARQDHIKALQEIYPRVEKYFKTTMKNTKLPFVFSGMDSFGQPEQEIEFLLCGIEYSELSGNIREDDLYQPTWTNNTDAQNTITFSKTYEETNQTNFKLSNGLRLGSSSRWGQRLKLGCMSQLLMLLGQKQK